MEDKKNVPRTLQELSPGESGMILSVGNQSGAVKRRLVDMGLTPGTMVKVTKIAPLGDPLEVSLRGYELSLRKDDAAQIQMGAPRRMTPPQAFKPQPGPGGHPPSAAGSRPRAGTSRPGLRPQRPRQPPHEGGSGGQPQLRQDHLV